MAFEEDDSDSIAEKKGSSGSEEPERWFVTIFDFVIGNEFPFADKIKAETSIQSVISQDQNDLDQGDSELPVNEGGNTNLTTEEEPGPSSGTAGIRELALKHARFWKTVVEPMLARHLIMPKEDGMQIFDALVEIADTVETMAVSSEDDWTEVGHRVTSVDLMDVLLAAKDDDVVIINHNDEVQHSRSLLLATLALNSPVVDPQDNKQFYRSYTAFSIPAHGRFPMKFPNWWDDRPAVFALDGNSGQISQSISIVPTGKITPPHMDYFSTPMTIYHVHGNKLWLFWPPTAKNISAVFRSNLLEIDSHIPIARAIAELEGLKILFVSNPVVFQMPAGTIHAVVTLTNACHLSLTPLSPELFQESMTNLTVVCEKYEAMARILREDEVKVQNDCLAEAFTALLQWNQLVATDGPEAVTSKIRQEMLANLRRLESVANRPPYNRQLVLPEWMTNARKRKLSIAEGSKKRRRQ